MSLKLGYKKVFLPFYVIWEVKEDFKPLSGTKMGSNQTARETPQSKPVPVPADKHQLCMIRWLWNTLSNWCIYRHITIYKIASEWEPSIKHRKLSSVLCDELGGLGWREVPEGGDVYVCTFIKFKKKMLVINSQRQAEVNFIHSSLQVRSSSTNCYSLNCVPQKMFKS